MARCLGPMPEALCLMFDDVSTLRLQQILVFMLCSWPSTVSISKYAESNEMVLCCAALKPAPVSKRPLQDQLWPAAACTCARSAHSKPCPRKECCTPLGTVWSGHCRCSGHSTLSQQLQAQHPLPHIGRFDWREQGFGRPQAALSLHLLSPQLQGQSLAVRGVGCHLKGAPCSMQWAVSLSIDELSCSGLK